MKLDGRRTPLETGVLIELKVRLQQYGLTQAMLTSGAGVAVTTITRWFAGDRPIKLGVIIAMCRVAGWDPLEFLTSAARRAGQL